MREADAGDLFRARLDDFMCQVSACCSYICDPAGGVKLSVCAPLRPTEHMLHHIALRTLLALKLLAAPLLCSRAAARATCSR